MFSKVSAGYSESLLSARVRIFRQSTPPGHGSRPSRFAKARLDRGFTSTNASTISSDSGRTSRTLMSVSPKRPCGEPRRSRIPTFVLFLAGSKRAPVGARFGCGRLGQTRARKWLEPTFHEAISHRLRCMSACHRQSQRCASAARPGDCLRSRVAGFRSSRRVRVSACARARGVLRRTNAFAGMPSIPGIMFA